MLTLVLTRAGNYSEDKNADRDGMSYEYPLDLDLDDTKALQAVYDAIVLTSTATGVAVPLMLIQDDDGCVVTLKAAIKQVVTN